jgi:tetratricopeptide (TPR) repeat protein
VKDDAQAWLWIGLAHEEGGETKEALQAYTQALRLNNRLFEALINRANIYLAAKDGELALEDFRAAQRLDKESYEASIGVGKALMLLDYAGDAYMQFMGTQGFAKEEAQKVELAYWRALSLDELGEQEAALREWKKLLELPAGSLTEEVRAYAAERAAALATATPTARPPTATKTVTPTQGRSPSATKPAATSTAGSKPQQSATPKASATPKPTSTR